MGGDTGGFIEIERKFDAPPGFALPDMSALPSVAAVTGPASYQLAATYYDTPGRRLAAARITLRRRTGGADDGWHLKLPAGAERREIHEPLGGGEPVPARLAAIVAGTAGGQPLAPIARLMTARVVRHLVGGDGRVLAEVADDRVRGQLPAGAPARDPAGAAWREAAAWREIEVELREGTAELLAAAAGLLLRSGARPAGHGSKLARLLASG